MTIEIYGSRWRNRESWPMASQDGPRDGVFTRLFFEQHDAPAGLDGADFSVFVHGDHQQTVHDTLLPLTWVYQQVGPEGGGGGIYYYRFPLTDVLFHFWLLDVINRSIYTPQQYLYPASSVLQSGIMCYCEFSIGDLKYTVYKIIIIKWSNYIEPYEPAIYIYIYCI